MSSTQTFSIPRLTVRCAATGDELVPGREMVVVLLEREEDEELDRLDFSHEAWDSGARPDTGKRQFASWRTEVPEPGKKENALIGVGGMLDLFEQLAETEDPRRQAFRYVLALMLMRKRQLEYVGVQGTELLVMPKGAPEDAEPVRVHDPQAAGQLDEASLVQLAEQIEQVIDTGEGSEG